MAAKIGIKLADGTFYPIMDEVASAFETLELTTVRDDQHSVQINLFKKEDDAEDLEYIGSLIVEDIHEKSAGDPTIQLQLALDDNKNLSAEALDVDSGFRQELKVSLETLSASGFDEIDFDISTDLENIDTSSGDTVSHSTRLHEENKTVYTEEQRKRFPVWLLVLLLLLGVGVLVVGIWLVKHGSGNSVVVAESDSNLMMDNTAAAKNIPDAEETEPLLEEKSADELPADEQTTQPPDENVSDVATNVEHADAADEEYDNRNAGESLVDSSFPAGTVRHKLAWGDTLWDISQTYYRNPWLYTKIVEHNKLKNPDLVISGTYIEIPPK